MNCPRVFGVAILCSIVLSAMLVVACGGSEGQTSLVDTRPIVGLMELPISHRNDAPAPSDAMHIEISPAELRLEHQPILTLVRGDVSRSEIAADGLTKLTTALRAAPARSRAAITAHSLVPYGTATQVVQSLVSAGYREMSFAVRPHSPTGAAPTQANWLAMSNPQIAEAGRGLLEPASYGGGVLQWRHFVEHWAEAYQACRAGSYVDCDPLPPAPADGGFLQVVLWARGSGMQIRFNRVGAPLPEPARPSGPALIEGVRAPTPGEGEEAPPDPSVTGAFAFRAMVATEAESPISNVMRPVCGASPCQVVIEADEGTPMMRVLSFIGASFPNGSMAPQIIFRLPRHEG